MQRRTVVGALVIGAVIGLIMVFSGSGTKKISTSRFSIEIPSSWVKMDEHPNLMLNAGAGMLYVDRKGGINALLIREMAIPENERQSNEELINKFIEENGGEKLTFSGRDFWVQEQGGMSTTTLVLATTEEDIAYMFSLVLDVNDGNTTYDYMNFMNKTFSSFRVKY
jgi:hypothetical protein